MSDWRVALFLPSLRGGGAERVMLELANAFAGQGLATDLVLPQVEGAYLDEVGPGVRVIDLRASRVLTSLPGLVRYLRRERPQALLATLSHASLVALWARRLSGVPARVVIREANTISRVAKGTTRQRGRLIPYLARLWYPSADAIVAVSEGVADDLRRTIGVADERVVVLPNPIVTPEVLRSAADPVEHPWFRPGEPPVVLGVGRLSPQKDFPTLIRAFAACRRRPLRLMILGEGPERDRLQDLVRELGLEQDVALPGFAPNPFAYMARAGVFVLSSAWEGMPGALIQALACGARVVSTDCESGPREVLDGGRLGRLVSVGDAEAMASAISAALDDGPRPSVDGALERFSAETAARRYLTVLGGPAHG